MRITSDSISAISAAVSAACAFITFVFSLVMIWRGRKADRIRNRPRIIVDLVKTGNDLLAFRVINKGIEPAIDLRFLECDPIPRSVARDEGDDEAWFIKEPIGFLASSQSQVCIIGSVHQLGHDDGSGRFKYKGRLLYKDVYGNIFNEQFSVDQAHYSLVEIETA